MYEFLHRLLEAAEELGEITKVTMRENDKVWGDCIEICGISVDNRVFELSLSVKEAEQDAEKLE